MNNVQGLLVFVGIIISFTSVFMTTIGNSWSQNEKLFGGLGHDFNSFFSANDLASLDSDVTKILKEQITEGDWFAAQDLAQKEFKSDDTRLWFCQQLKDEDYYQPFVNCQDAIYDQKLYQNMYKMYATKVLIQHAQKIAAQDKLEGSP
jgi:hypothetical protein